MSVPKLLTILLLGLLLEAVGVVFLSRGLKTVGAVETVSVSEVVRVVKRGLTNGPLLLGIFFEALFFACLLVLMAKAEVSFIWPLTALGFVLTTLAAKLILHEQVSALRWSGVLLIMAGAALVSWSENVKPKPHPLPPAAAAPEPGR